MLQAVGSQLSFSLMKLTFFCLRLVDMPGIVTGMKISAKMDVLGCTSAISGSFFGVLQ